MNKFIRMLGAVTALGILLAAIPADTALAAPKTMADGTVFDARYYADSYADIKAAFGYDEGALWQHYTAYGKNEGRACAAGSGKSGTSARAMADGTVFDYVYYADRYPDVKAAFGYNETALWNHYQTFGKREGRMAYGGQIDKRTSGEVNMNTAFPWFIRVNRAANTVTVYGYDYNGTYSIAHKAFVCSAGNATPLGTYRTSDKVRWLSLVGGVYGQYTTRISGPFWFHSVPYFTASEADLEYLEYNKLGSLASLGCVRMTVADVKWIYDNCPSGTTVEIYDDANNPGPLGKPSAQRIDVNSTKRGWDPTDPNAENPWRQ